MGITGLDTLGIVYLVDDVYDIYSLKLGVEWHWISKIRNILQVFRVEPTETLLASLDAASQNLESAAPVEILQWAVENYPKLRDGDSIWARRDDHDPYALNLRSETPIFNLETGYQFQETLGRLREKVKQRYGIEVQLVRPELDVVEYEQLHGGPVYKSDPNKCCYDRKLSLLKRSPIDSIVGQVPFGETKARIVRKHHRRLGQKVWVN